MTKYDPQTIEANWQAYWADQHTFATPNPGDEGFDPDKPKFYVLDMFPYPSGVGLHVGHPLGYIATDIVSRYMRMKGYNVLHPMGYDAFGLPAEQFAVEHGVHPRITTEQNIANMTRQLKRLGLSYDWDRCVATTDVDYYQWTQWIFKQLFESWFDPRENKARPIETLRAALEAGELKVDDELRAVTEDENGARAFSELTTDEQRKTIDNHRLAYIAEVPVNWCPQLGTVLANEEVTNDGRSERGNYPVFKRPLKQWMLRITAYCERLIDELDLVDWPESVKLLQRNWVGRSRGAEVDFKVAEREEVIRVFTTRPDTLFGATYMVLSPEHPLIDKLTTDEQRAAVEQYKKEAAAKSDIDRQAENKEKTGVFTGSFAINPVNNERIPIWTADYVMMGYGTGAIMAVPAHDTRDYEFASKFELPIVEVVSGGDVSQEAYTGEGKLVNSANDEVSLNGLPVPEAKQRITDWLESKGLGQAKTQYKLRDWLFSRQRYWGEPFPVLHELDEQGNQTGVVRAVPDDHLPVQLPGMADFKPEASDDPDAPPRPPLSRADEIWRIIELDGKRYERELNTMPQWAGSCWYYLRYLDPKNSERFCDPAVEKYWMNPGRANNEKNASRAGIDLYVGGVEHAVLHLLYARFWHKVLFDLGHVSTPEPFGKLFNQGYIQAYYYEDERGVRVQATEVVNQDGKPAAEVQGSKGQQFFYEGQPVTERYGKMGKSLKNAVAPDEVCEQYGCDALRLYEMYMGPLDQSKAWSTSDIVGVYRFLQRLWRNFINEETGALLLTEDKPSDEINRLLHKTIARVTESMEHMSYNTAIAALIELNNALVPREKLERAVAEPMLLMLAPLAPHMAEELWQKLGHSKTLTYEAWPSYDPALLKADTIELPVQVNGKMRGKITVPADADQAVIETAAQADEKVAAAMQGKQVRKVIVVPGRLVNIVVG